MSHDKLRQLIEAERQNKKGHFAVNGLRRIYDLPRKFFELTHLKGISFYNCSLNRVSPAIKKMVNLILINLENNNILELPTELTHLKNIQFIYLNLNKIEELPDVGNLPNLEEIQLERNKLVGLPMWLKNSPKLEVILLKGNYLTKVPEVLKHLPNLIRVDLNNNLIKPSFRLGKTNVYIIDESRVIIGCKVFVIEDILNSNDESFMVLFKEKLENLTNNGD
jgi:Leucine-rich repeat (LRR) protein